MTSLSPEQLLRLLSDPTRLRCLMLLMQEGELCVCELTHALATVQPKISRHFAMLRKASVVLDQRAGQWIYYRINPELPGWAQDLLNATLQGARGQHPFKQDLRTLKTMTGRPENRRCA